MPVTYRELAQQVTGLAAGLIAAGVQAGDRVVLFSGTRFEWMLCDYAIWAAGAVTVPVYETSSAEQVEWILSDSGARAVFAENDAHAATITSIKASLTDLQSIWLIDTMGVVTAGG